MSPNPEQKPPRPDVYGAAPERTALAWQRTGLGVIVGSFMVFRTAVDLDLLPVGVLGLARGLLIAALSVFVFPSARYLLGDPADSWLLLIVITAAVVALGMLGLGVALAALL
jgi:uncharacterized membrane protein YidH (DUF202 family)